MPGLESLSAQACGSWRKSPDILRDGSVVGWVREQDGPTVKARAAGVWH